MTKILHKARDLAIGIRKKRGVGTLLENDSTTDKGKGVELTDEGDTVGDENARLSG